MQRDSRNRAYQQLYETVFLLASEKGRIEERLAHAYFSYIQWIDSDLLPPEVRPRLEKILAQLKTMYPIQDVVDGVSRDAAVNLAQGIILLYDDLYP